MTRFDIVIEKDEEGFYTSEVVGLPGCHTQAKSIDELIQRTREAIELYLECETPNFTIQSEFIDMQKIEV